MKTGEELSARYVIKELIGKGGMQEVYLARDKLLETDVALKTPQAGQVKKKFSNSAIIAARVNHHNVAKTLDYFEKDSIPYLVEEFVVGETLEEKLVRFGAVDPHLAVRVFLHLAKGISASHRAGVVHRDLKPSNIIAEPGVNLHELKITDFGIATLTEEVFEEAAKDGDLTKSTSATIRGALPYMAPEMMFREAGVALGKEMDIWALGALMFRVLTAEYPFGVYFKAVVNVQNKNRTAWPKFMISNPQYKTLSLELQKLVEKCLQHEPSDRPSADDLINEISQICYVNTPRFEGVVSNFIQGGVSGFATDAKGGVFFSMESVYGSKKPNVNENKTICYSKFPGSPKFRGHPIVVINEQS